MCRGGEGGEGAVISNVGSRGSGCDYSRNLQGGRLFEKIRFAPSVIYAKGGED